MFFQVLAHPCSPGHWTEGRKTVVVVIVVIVVVVVDKSLSQEIGWEKLGSISKLTHFLLSDI